LNHKIKNHTLSKRLSLALNSTHRRLIKGLIKALVTIWAIYYVWSHIDSTKMLETLSRANSWWLFAAFVAFNLSKISSSFRLNYYFRAIGIKIDEYSNLKLYYIGMFYNLFLPGGIGGDGYKAYLLQKRYSAGYKSIISSLLLDRISGVVALLLFGGILYFFSSFRAIYSEMTPLVLLGVISILPLNYILTQRFFDELIGVFVPTTIYAFVVQALQLLSALFIVWSLPIEGIYLVDYLLLFLISSIVAILPISVGGIGVRELTFLYGFSIIGADTTTAVTFSLIFFLITVISSLIGAFVSEDIWGDSQS